jgi:hypothetical protein
MQIDPSREMFGRSGLGRVGITETKQFFSDRNALVLLELWDAIASVGDAPIRQKLRFAFTGCLARASRRYQWGPKRPLNAQNQTYYVAPVYFEWNVFELFERKIEAGVRSDKLLFDQAPLLLRSFADKASYHAYPVHAPKPPVQITSFDPEPLMPALNVANGRNGSHVAPSFSQTIT